MREAENVASERPKGRAELRQRTCFLWAMTCREREKKEPPARRLPCGCPHRSSVHLPIEVSRRCPRQCSCSPWVAVCSPVSFETTSAVRQSLASCPRCPLLASSSMTNGHFLCFLDSLRSRFSQSRRCVFPHRQPTSPLGRQVPCSLRHSCCLCVDLPPSGAAAWSCGRGTSAGASSSRVRGEQVTATGASCADRVRAT